MRKKSEQEQLPSVQYFIFSMRIKRELMYGYKKFAKNYQKY